MLLVFCSAISFSFSLWRVFTFQVAKTARATSNRTAVSKPKPPPQTAPHSSSIRRSTKGVTAPPKKNARDSTAAAEAPTTKEQHVSSTPEAVQGRVKKQVQCSCSRWPTGNGKNLSNSQACCLAQLCLAAA